MNKRIVITIVLGVIVLGVLIYAVNYHNKSSSNESNNTTCLINADCVKQQTTCCSCSMGGEEQCMSQAEALMKQEELPNCPVTACIAMYACQDLKCGCINGKCMENSIISAS